MKAICSSLHICALLLLPISAYAQDDTAAIVPWTGLQEYTYNFFPLGGWNNAGGAGLRSLAMGETLLSNMSWASCALNPAALSLPPGGQASLGYGYSSTSYKVESPGNLYMINSPREETLTFNRNGGRLDGAGILMPFGRWTVAAGYSVFQDFDLPEVRNPFWWPWSVKESGETSGLHIGLSHRFSGAFAAGASVTYIFGGLDRLEISPLYYILLEGAGPDRGPSGAWGPDLRYPYAQETRHDISMAGLAFGLGFVFRPGEKWLLGLALRPPFKVGIEGDISSKHSGFDFVETYRFAADSDLYYPFRATVSLLYHPIRPLQLAADISTSSWSEFTTDYPPLGTAAWFGFRNTFRLNLGAEYLLRLPFHQVDGLALRAGYAYDPQPYMHENAFARNFAFFGIGLKVGRLDIESAAKISMFPGLTQKFHTTWLKFGLTYRFD